LSMASFFNLAQRLLVRPEPTQMKPLPVDTL
jgi:hypothetical protein